METSNDIKDPGVDVGKGPDAETNVEVTAPQKEPKEDQARSMGWVNLHEWTEAGNDPEDHVSAKEFVARDSFFKKINAQNKENSTLRQQIQSLQHTQKLIFEEAKRRAIQELKDKHNEAVEAGDLAKADQLVDEISKKHAEPNPVQPAPSGPSAYVQQWMQDNSWYAENDVKRAYANAVGVDYVNQYRMSNNGAIPSEEETLTHVEKRVKEKFPVERKPLNKTTVQAPHSPAAVASQTGRTKKPGLTVDDLSPMEQSIMKSLVARGDITEEKYLADIEALNKKGK